jgi:ABC-type histidine transport system ATPase subunit
MYIIVSESDQTIIPDCTGKLIGNPDSSGYFMFDSIESVLDYEIKIYGKVLKKISAVKKESKTYIIRTEWVFDFERHVEFHKAIMLNTWSH